jgi:adenine-specific DNA-methyltransferase
MTEHKRHPRIASAPKGQKVIDLSIRSYPQYVKYMGSKTKLLPFVVEGISSVHVAGRPVCDLFAGSCSLSGALGHAVPIISNDIQAYSSVLAAAYLRSYRHGTPAAAPHALVSRAEQLVNRNRDQLPPDLDSSQHTRTIAGFVDCEERNRKLVNATFSFHYHLFTKYYAGTWWSAEQCLWIDALREVADQHQNQPEYPVILTSIMHAMAYVSQGTGHYAQYRDATSRSSMLDIAIYRSRSMRDYFFKKYTSAYESLTNAPPPHVHVISTLDFKECLTSIPRSTVYADPPYCFVHYSRFYHALETLVLYDFPPIQRQKGKFVKGRYREYRHQSPFCIETQVRPAFAELFSGVENSGSNLVLSYSNTGMIDLPELKSIARDVLGPSYTLNTVDFDHVHMTMGRRQDRQRNVKECLITAQRT